MNVTRDVIGDLWPLYQAGEVSHDSRRMIEEFLHDDPEFAALVQESPEVTIKTATLPPLTREPALALLQRTKRFVWLREALFWIAVFLTSAPLTMWDTSWGSGWLIRDLPWLAGSIGVGAAIVWYAYFTMKRRLSASGM